MAASIDGALRAQRRQRARLERLAHARLDGEAAERRAVVNVAAPHVAQERILEVDAISNRASVVWHDERDALEGGGGGGGGEGRSVRG